MKPLILKLLALGGVIAMVAILWPIFTQAETSLAIIFVVLSLAGIGIAAIALFSGRRWMLWAALGVWPGAIGVGLITGGLTWLTLGFGNENGGFEGLVAGAIILLGIFVGAIAGAITGGVLGARKTRRVNSGT